jgi:hypothetical protein
MVTAGKPIASLRWWIGGLLFASTVINYIDRQTLSLLAPYLKLEYYWSNSDYANIAIAFRVAYSIGQTVFGETHGPHRHPPGPDPHGNLVFAGLDVDVLLGGESRTGVLVYGHANGGDIEETADAVAENKELGYLAVRAQTGVPGLPSTYGVAKDKLFEPAEEGLPPENVWSSG